MPLVPKGEFRTPPLGLVDLFSKVVFGASGAVASQTAAGVSGVVVTKPAGTGLYRLTFEDNWDSMAGILGTMYTAATAKGLVVEVTVKLGAVTSKVADIQLALGDGTDTDATSGDELWLRMTMSNSGHGPQV